MNTKAPIAAKLLNIALLISFLVTILVPLTGVIVHKLASTLFLLLCLVHTIVYRKRLNQKRYIMLAVIFLAYLTGLFGLIFDEIPLILALHKVISIVCVIFLAVHIFVFQRGLRK